MCLFKLYRSRSCNCEYEWISNVPCNLWMSYLRQDTSCPWLYPVNEQQFRTLSCVHYTIFFLVKLDLYIRALLLDHILVREKTTRTLLVHLVILVDSISGKCSGKAREDSLSSLEFCLKKRPHRETKGKILIFLV